MDPKKKPGPESPGLSLLFRALAYARFSPLLAMHFWYQANESLRYRSPEPLPESSINETGHDERRREIDEFRTKCMGDADNALCRVFRELCATNK